jgi:anti-anti-sigma regulatory factor
MLINLHKFAQKHEGSVKLINPNTQIRKILSISRFDKKFAIE